MKGKVNHNIDSQGDLSVDVYKILDIKKEILIRKIAPIDYKIGHYPAIRKLV